MTAQEQRAALILFFQAWTEWVKSGAPFVQPFHRSGGLCASLANWTECVGFKHDDYITLRAMLKQLFIVEYADGLYPFGQLDYERRYQMDSMHTCPRRYAFCIKMITQLEKLNGKD